MPNKNVPEGRYHGKANDVYVTTSSTGKEFLAIELEFSYKMESTGWEQIEPFRRTLRFFLTNAAWKYTSEKLQAVGFNGDFENPDLSAETKDRGITCDIKTKNGYDELNLVYEGNRGRAERAEVNAEKLMRLTARYRTEAQLQNEPEQAPPSVGGSEAPDDVPF